MELSAFDGCLRVSAMYYEVFMFILFPDCRVSFGRHHLHTITERSFRRKLLKRKLNFHHTLPLRLILCSKE